MKINIINDYKEFLIEEGNPKTYIWIDANFEDKNILPIELTNK